jgi:hypothetical protein
MTTITLRVAERLLENMFRGEYCSLELPGKDPQYGIVDQISFNYVELATGNKVVTVQMNERAYHFELTYLHQCLKRLKSS